jgi:Asp-tRNA(Asn)/Glu-tRNA(Gln) amidotransferase C subunit
MALSKEDRVRELARLVGIPIMEAEITEVTNRFEALMQVLDRLNQFDLADIQPVIIFPEEEP